MMENETSRTPAKRASAEPRAEEPPTKTPSKQSSLTSLWGLQTPSPEQTPNSHKKQRTASYESPASSAAFFKELETKRLEAEKAEKERQEAAAARRAEASAKGKALDPADFGRGVKRGLDLGGRPRGSAVSNKGTHKPRAAPTIRRDPVAQVKLQVVMDWNKHADKHDVDKFTSLPAEVRTSCSRSTSGARRP